MTELVHCLEARCETVAACSWIEEAEQSTPATRPQMSDGESGTPAATNANVPAPSSVRSDAEVYIDQARWLLEWHNRRSEGFVNRAIGVLGFDGVALALVVQAPGSDTSSPSALGWTLIGLLLVAFVVSAAFALATLWSVGVTAPSPDQLRRWWDRHRKNPENGSAAPNIAESFLDSLGGGMSPVATARDSADRRAKRFKFALAPLAIATPLLALLAVDVLARTYS